MSSNGLQQCPGSHSTTPALCYTSSQPALLLTCASLLLLIAMPLSGALIAAATDLSFNPRGYAAVLCNDLLTSLYLIMVKNTPATNGLRCGLGRLSWS